MREQAAQDTLAHAQQRQEQARAAIRGLSQAYHPIDLQTGALRTVAQVDQDVRRCVDTISTVAAAAALPERCLNGITKVQRLLPALAATLTFFQQQVARLLGALGLGPD